MQYCTKCVYPAVAATPVTFDADGVCSGCRVGLNKVAIDWNERKRLFIDLIDQYRTESEYDCILPVSGGKDSYRAAHIAKEFGLKALLVTYHGNNYLPEGETNLKRMREVFPFDHIVFRPSQDALIRLNRAGFTKTGDMNWHCHAGIFTYPMQIAIKYKIPLVFWGDHGFTEHGGMYTHNDFFEFTAKDRYENGLHGYDWFDFEGVEGLTKKDLQFLMYPDDAAIMDVGLRGIYLSNYFPFDGAVNAEIARDQYGWLEAQQSFDRTYRRVSNVDDMHENGVHDYMKFIKLGYGRASDHAQYDIRAGRMTREEGIAMVRKYDHVKPSDIVRWLSYTGMTEDEFDAIADTFRNHRVWSIQDGQWVKENIWGGTSSYGPVKGLPEWAKTA
ncbi:N-acetyl sugar amidotransferase [Tardiphaga sp. vice278]|uniref:N-acetyl sugar amidotransferase n=1 Tax=Tardiphaga sp. vice278 TaxID=2592815 RepID=UPI001163BDD3|nr:N-acetyl sugar amidotransferase [Tardiphaga sp. vice278]QDM17969.1 N-acetyl sugar amidotransferase [Tardiphaga sp. vice278]